MVIVVADVVNEVTVVVGGHKFEYQHKDYRPTCLVTINNMTNGNRTIINIAIIKATVRNALVRIVY